MGKVDLKSGGSPCGFGKSSVRCSLSEKCSAYPKKPTSNHLDFHPKLRTLLDRRRRIRPRRIQQRNQPDQLKLFHRIVKGPCHTQCAKTGTGKQGDGFFGGGVSADLADDDLRGTLDAAEALVGGVFDDLGFAVNNMRKQNKKLDL